ncbi:hypothetical protein FRC08_009034 [Ceratobasidium sp. 394]|nr:hypothetical protein FRC08_009034 [Ceratobasidium sp. 394]
MVESQAVGGNSPKLVHINDIPSEILSQFFELAVSYFIHHPKQRTSKSLALHPLAVFPSVCTRWRHISTSTRSLWSHIDIRKEYMGKGDETTLLERTRLWLERARGPPLWLILREQQGENIAKELASMLRPHAAYIASLEFEETSEIYFLTILGLFLNHSSPGMLNTLVANLTNHSSQRDPSQGTDTGTNVNAPRFIWPTGALQGIVDLQLIGIPYRVSPSLDELVTVLSNSPRLQTLVLRGVYMTSSREGKCPDITLPHLTLLDIDPGFSPGPRELVSALIPGTRELEIRLRMPDDHEWRTTLQALLKRSNVTGLVVRNLGLFNEEQFDDYIKCLPHLQKLVLIYLPGEDSTGLGALTQFDGRTVSARCSNLRSLSLIGCAIDSYSREYLRWVAGCHRLKELIFKHDTIFIAGDPEYMTMDRHVQSDEDTESEDDGDIDYTLAWLRRRVERVVFASRFCGPR